LEVGLELALSFRFKIQKRKSCHEYFTKLGSDICLYLILCLFFRKERIAHVFLIDLTRKQTFFEEPKIGFKKFRYSSEKCKQPKKLMLYENQRRDVRKCAPLFSKLLKIIKN